MKKIILLKSLKRTIDGKKWNTKILVMDLKAMIDLKAMMDLKAMIGLKTMMDLKAMIIDLKIKVMEEEEYINRDILKWHLRVK